MLRYELVLSILYKFFKKDRRYAYYKKLRANIHLSRKEVLENQNKSIQELIIHAYTTTEYYKNLLDEYGIKPESVKTRKDLNKLPPLTKQLIKENIDKLKSNDYHGKTLKKVTSSGSTGEIGVIYRSKFYEAMSRASWLRNNSMIGWMPFDKSVWIWTSPAEHKNVLKKLTSRIGMFLNRRIFMDAFNYSEDDFPVWYDKISSFKPKVVFGNPSVILEFSTFLIKNKLKFSTVKLVVTTTEKLKKREVIEAAFNCPLYDQYGCSEIIAVGIEHARNEMVFTDDVVLVKTDSQNQFLLTALYSFGFPLINYKVGDVGKVHGVNLNDNKFPFPKINLKIGRITDNFLIDKNRKISTSSLGSYMATLDLRIKEHQIIQHNYKKFEVNFISLKDTNVNRYYSEITHCIEKCFGKNTTIKFNNVLKIPIEKSGKRLMFKRTFNLEI